MAHQIPTSEPTSLRAGDSWTWTRADLSDYPASVWTLTYHFRNAGSFFDVTASADGDSFLVDVAAATTAAYSPGRYTWTALATDGTDRHEVGAGVIEVLFDVSAAVAYDGRSLPRQLLDAVESILSDRATENEIDLVASAIGDRSMTRDPAFLLEYRTKLEQEVKALEKTGGMQRIVVRLGNA